jgi:hypothetical protein
MTDYLGNYSEDYSDEAAATSASGANSKPDAAPAMKIYDPNPERENIRGKIAMQLLWLMGGMMLCILLLLVFGVISGVDDVLKLIGGLLTPVVGLFGAVMGFYFGEKSALGATSPPPSSVP